MEVHIIVHQWCNYDNDGTETRGVFLDKSVAIRKMRRLADEEMEGVQSDWGEEFDDDFDNDGDDYISYGWYNKGLGPDCKWEWRLETEEVQ